MLTLQTGFDTERVDLEFPPLQEKVLPPRILEKYFINNISLFRVKSYDSSFKNVRGGWTWDLTPILGFLKMVM